MSTNAIVAVQSNTGWQYVTIHYDGNSIGPLLARWYKNIWKARQLLCYEYIESLPSEPSLINADRLEEPREVLQQEQIFDVHPFCQHFYFLADKPNPKWVYAKGVTGKSRQIMRPGSIPGHRVWVDTVRSKGDLFIHVYFGEEKVVTIGPDKLIGNNFVQVRQAQDLGEKLYAFMQQVEFVQDKGKPPIKFFGKPEAFVSTTLG